MNRYDYLETLDRLLSSLSYSERREIMYDYEEHFKEGLKEGKTEEEIITSLGMPDKVAGQYVTALVPIAPQVNLNESRNLNGESTRTVLPQRPIKRGNGIGEIVALTIMMIFFNIFVSIFYFTGWSILIAFVATGASLLIAGFALLVSAIIATPVAFLSVPALFLQYPVLMFIGSVILICIGGLMLIAMFYLIKFTCILTIRYIKWNIKLIRGF